MFSDPEKVKYSHLMRGERFTHNWLDDAGYGYEVATDYDLHRMKRMQAYIGLRGTENSSELAAVPEPQMRKQASVPNAEPWTTATPSDSSR